ncbi:MAG: hypothetical protein V4502_09810 [Pseudomonadota bacterium]
MSHAQAAAFDRLPWLTDEPSPARTSGKRSELTGWAIAATVLVAGVSYWMGANSGEQPAAPSSRVTTVQLPEPYRMIEAQPQVQGEPMPEVDPIVAPPMPAIAAPVKRAAPRPTVSEAREEKSSAKPDTLQPWPARQINGASGRLVRVGTFYTSRQAKKGWWAIVRNNPALAHLPALVVPVRSLRDGRIYYRLQMGTTSQAHSAVLCQRMRMIAVSCVVIGLDQAKVAG